jgi:hypothetical protein
MRYRNRKPMRHAQPHSPCSLPATPLRLPEDLPAGRVGRPVPKCLIWIVLLTRRLSICGSESIFLPAFREAPGVRRRGDLRLIAARGSTVEPGPSRRPVRRPPVQALRHPLCEEARPRMAEADIPFNANPTASVRDRARPATLVVCFHNRHAAKGGRCLCERIRP